MTTPTEFTVTLSYPAYVENRYTDERVSDPQLLSKLDGVTEWGDLAELMDEDLGLPVSRAVPVLRYWESTEELTMDIPFELEREASQLEIEKLAAWTYRLIEGDWTYEFELPEEFHECQVHFASRPLGIDGKATKQAIQAILSDYPGWTYETLEKLSDEALEQLAERIRPLVVRDYLASGVEAALLTLSDAVKAQLQSREVDRVSVRALADTLAVSLDGAD